MSSTQRIKVTIDPLGNPMIEAFGFSGGACKEATKNLEQIFAGGGGVVTTEHKPEYYADSDATVHQEQTAW